MLFSSRVGTHQELIRYCEHLEKRRRHFSSCCQHLKAGESKIPFDHNFFQISLTIQWVGVLWLKSLFLMKSVDLANQLP
jgi:hypothetical protein